MFQQAEAYGNMRNAPSSFVRSFMDKQAQVQIDIVNAAQEKASKIRTEKTNKAFATKNEKMYNDANKEYEKRMETVRAFRDKLAKIGNKFLS